MGRFYMNEMNELVREWVEKAEGDRRTASQNSRFDCPIGFTSTKISAVENFG